MNEDEIKREIKCTACKYYHITWDQNLPYGCKIHGFKSKQIPSILVKQTSGEDCLAFENKNEKLDSYK